MNSEVIEKRVNPLLKRLEIMFKVEHEGATPSREEIRNNLAAMFNAKKELVIIGRMRSEYGKRETRGYAKIYNSEKDLRNIEQAHIIQRNVIKTEVEEKPAEKVETKKEVEEKPAEKVETKKEVEEKPKEKSSKEIRAEPKTKSKGE